MKHNSCSSFLRFQGSDSELSHPVQSSNETMGTERGGEREGERERGARGREREREGERERERERFVDVHTHTYKCVHADT